MREDIYEPLSRYRDEFREKFAGLTAEKFEELKTLSGIDEESNRLLVETIKKLSVRKEKTENRRAMWGTLSFLAGLAAAAGIIAVIYALVSENADISEIRIHIITGGAVTAVSFLLLLFQWILPAFRDADKKVKELENEINEKRTQAYEQMAPLNALFDWSITAELIEKTVPRLQFDKFFTEARLHDLKESFGWEDAFNQPYSVVHSHSGVINDNPFVFAELRRQEWQTKRYYGSLQIFWTETIRDSEGRRRTVTRSQTLTAYVDKPVPVYINDKVLIYGNDAAPDLDFSRTPSDLSGESGGLWNSVKRAHRLNKLKKFARNLDDDSDFTMMSNEEFELLFHAKDRNDEVGFRLLFTPLAQQQMVNLLNDRETGFGDDFCFFKDNKINIITAAHLDQISFSHDPAQYRGYDCQAMRDHFQRYNERFFKAVYFALAPLLIIPLYQQTRTTRAIYGKTDDSHSSFWEHEALANYYGDSRFEHPDCITQNILKARCVSRDDSGCGTVEVEAHGFCGIQMLDHVNVYGGDGRFHAVPVEWTDYQPVSRTSYMTVKENPAQEDIKEENSGNLLRRSIYSYLHER